MTFIAVGILKKKESINQCTKLVQWKWSKVGRVKAVCGAIDWIDNLKNRYNRSIFIKVIFESHLIYKWRYHRQAIFNQLNIMVPNVDITGLYHSVAILLEINGCGLNVMWVGG